MGDHRSLLGNRDRVVAAIFALSVVGTLIFDAAHAWFWQRAHDTAPVAAVLVLVLGVVQLALLLSVPMRRYVGVGRWRGSQPVGLSGA